MFEQQLFEKFGTSDNLSIYHYQTISMVRVFYSQGCKQFYFKHYYCYFDEKNMDLKFVIKNIDKFKTLEYPCKIFIPLDNHSNDKIEYNMFKLSFSETLDYLESLDSLS